MRFDKVKKMEKGIEKRNNIDDEDYSRYSSLRIGEPRERSRGRGLVDRNSLIAFFLIILIVGVVFLGYYVGYGRIYEGIRKYGEAIGIIPPEVMEFEYVDEVLLEVSSDYEYMWVMGNYGKLKSVRLDGTVSKEGSAKVYLEHEGKEYLIFDSSRLDREEVISGFAVGVNQGSLDDESKENVDVVSEGEPIKNKSIINKKIIEIITTQSGERAALDDVFEFNIWGKFNWDVDYSKICTKWDVNSVSLCYGSGDCCALIGLESLGKWNDTFYLSYGRYDSKIENVVRAQVIYANYSLDVLQPYSDIVYSDVKDMGAEFYEARIGFENICIETCLLPGFEASSYKLIFVIENASLNVDNIRYTVEKEIIISKNAPSLIKDIENITVYKNEESFINLSSYFEDEDGDELTYVAYKADNIDVVIEDSVARIVPEYNFTGKRHMFFTASDGYYNVSSNVFSVDVVERGLRVFEVNVSEELIKPRVVINRPVRWIKRVNVSYRVINLSVNISSDALNVTVRDVKEDRVISSDKIKINDKGVIKNYSVYRAEKRIEQIEKIEDRLERKKEEIISERPTAVQEISSINRELLDLENERNRLTGYVVAYNGEDLFSKFLEFLSNIEIAGYAIYEPFESEANVTAVIIEDIVEEIEIEYYTEAPMAEEIVINEYTKRVIVSSDVHYEDILAYTYLDDVPQSNIRLYRINGGRKLVSNVSYYDENGNGLVDYIEWIIPSLSNVTYEIIVITKAVHLDSNRSFVADIYGYVRERDGNWSPVIPSGEYVRVTFEQELDNTRDITIYARSNGSADIEVYREDDDRLITKFMDVSDEDWYKVYLSNLNENESYKTFDLRIISNQSFVEFDYIVDPKIGAAGNISFVPPTFPNGTVTTQTWADINVSVKANLSEFIFNWNGINHTFYNDSLVLMFNFDNVFLLGENDTYVVDVSTSGNNGIVMGAVTNPIGGKYGGGLQFDGVDDYVNVSDEGLNLSILSVEFWFKPDEDYDTSTDYVSFVYHKDYEIFIQNGSIVFDYKGDIISSLTDSWSRGQWYHIAATYDGYTQIIYIDGEYEKSAIVAGPFIVRNNNGEDVALFSNHGDIILKGSCSAGSCSYPGDDSFVIQDLLGDTIAYIDSTGDLCIEDLDCNDNDASCDSPGDGSFIVKNSTDDIISYIDGTGNLCLRGDLIENGNP